ncbi:hypothetical protein K1T73_02845 [Roseovarius sp. SCSIO 43702]|nr:hypothetical protein K1T73_02845 [Roseovarius sp. SCSIO 43702]
MSAIAATAWADAPVVSKVNVEADLSAYKRSNALEYWPTLADDLGAAIGALVAFEDGENPIVNVEIKKVAIDGDTVLPDSGEFNYLEGQVVVHQGVDETVEKAVDDRGSEVIQTFTLIVTAMTDPAALPESTVVIPPSQNDFYNALVGAYALKVVERLDLD